ncbi:ATP-dependent helicase [Aquifex aeolicus]|uniref:DNA 3'-5' helicase n=1 Tax=Aquifex aeolicus (strain VF5) TaxID=224324 RepID=O66983_AQUAE|nr:UvrD-helicase domain-containing protein [Aquifex aeolicus]AAC06949.1 ATP-dependent DNA helicase REP [Aquifex aeolicus VF5]
MKLNTQQEEAVRHFGSPLLVVAGAGSGKTKTLTHKVEYLIKEKGLKPYEILCITFTNKAAKEIKERIKNTFGLELEWSGTFHSVALKILKKDGEKIGIPKDFSIADEKDTTLIVKEILKKYGLKKEPEEVKEKISKVKENFEEPEAWLGVLLEEYQRVLRENKLLDFSDLMRELYNLLLVDEVREKYRNTFKYIMVDEYQDTNNIQYEILKLLANKNICAIGDPNQCIYEWRDARPDNILRFIEDFNPKIIKLELNYRSREPILRVANAVLEASTLEWKDLIPKLRGVRGEGQKPYVRRFQDEEEEALWISRKIKELAGEYELKDIAVLVRVGYITDVFERTFFKAGIPYKVVGTIKFYERIEIKNLIALLRLIYNPSDEVAFKRLTEFFVKGFGDKSFEVVKKNFKGNWFKALKESLKKLPKNAAISAYEFLKAVVPLYKNPEKYHEGLEAFVEKIDYYELLKEKFKKDYEERIENVKEFLSSLKDFYAKAYTLEDLLAEITLTSEEEEEENAVKILTIHSAKGLEFPVVFLPRLEEGILPHHRSQESERELEEERRLFYVAITRAKDLLFMSYTKKENRKPSRFLSDIPKHLLDLSAFKKKKKVAYEENLRPNRLIKKGDKVIHRVFGKGVVLRIEEERAKVRFENGEEKVIHTSFLEPLKTPSGVP